MNQIKGGALLSYISIFGNILVAVFYTPFFIRTMGTEGYGIYNLAISFLGIISILDLSFGNTIAKYISHNKIFGNRTTESNLLGNIMWMYFYLTIITFIIGLIIYFNLDKLFYSSLSEKEFSDLKIMIILLLIFILISFYPGMFNGVLQAYEYFIITKGILLVRVILPALVSTPFLLLGFGAITVIIITLTIHVMGLIIGMILCFKKTKVRIELRKNWRLKSLYKNKELNNYLIIMLLSIAVEQITLNTGQIILGITSGTVAVAIYVIAIQFTKIYQQFATSVYNITFPMLNRLVNNKASNSVILTEVIKISRTQLIVLLLIFSGFFVFGKDFVKIWAGNDFEPAYYMTIILMFSITFQLCQLPAVSILQAKNLQKFRLILLISTLILSIIISLIVSYQYEGIGVTIVISLFSYILYTIIMNFYYHNKLKLDIKKFWKEMSKIYLPNIILMIIFKYLFDKFNYNGIKFLILSIVLYSVIYIIICWKFILNKEEKRYILKRN
ncbi:oligosaccharide flippase family protein [Staphylococcus haemolyticus]|uniref:oligosaccharide flippase family protein n=1 Tax=Staphylococcus haemolyticus TaxID=1283 RepID=UPI001F0C4ECB|nr:oligosaccharide flippase family protein [Staphylococcus haemolyticus]MCH4382003.1 oligosaccharide flippase family protein [Staphylococcus haemolyticus]